MIENILNIYQQYSEFTKDNQFLGAAIAGIVVGACTWALKSVPLKLYNGIKLVGISSLTVNCDEHWANRDVYHTLVAWIQPRTSKMTKHIGVSMCTTDEDYKGVHVRPGTGIHFFVWERKLYWYTITSDSVSSTSPILKESIKISCFGLNTNKLRALVANIFPITHNRGVPIFTWNTGWIKKAHTYRALESVFTENSVADSILHQITEFTKSQSWYNKFGVPYKLTYLLAGTPGCGKTSLIRALASHLGKPLYTLNLGSMSDASLDTAISEIPNGAILALEDIDCIGSSTLTNRDAQATKQADNKQLSLSGILNILDGIKPLHDIIIFMSSNRPDSIDEALLRKGRCDHRFDLLPLTYDSVNKFCMYTYNRELPSQFKSLCIKGCDLQAVFIENKGSFSDFLTNLKGLNHDC